MFCFKNAKYIWRVEIVLISDRNSIELYNKTIHNNIQKIRHSRGSTSLWLKNSSILFWEKILLCVCTSFIIRSAAGELTQPQNVIKVLMCRNSHKFYRQFRDTCDIIINNVFSAWVLLRITTISTHFCGALRHDRTSYCLKFPVQWF